MTEAPAAETATPSTGSTRAIAIVGSPTALGGHFPGMERGPESLRGARLVERLQSRAGFARTTFVDHGDAPNDLGWVEDPDPLTKNRDRIIEYLPRLSGRIQTALGPKGSPDADPPLLLLGGDCTSHAAAMAALKWRRPDLRLAIAWFDAHGDFNTPTSTPSGNVWGMPFAMLCGRGDAGLVAACGGPTVLEEDAVLIGGQVLDEMESRMLASSGVAHFGAGMMGGVAGLAALEAWARVVGDRCDALYIAFDLDAIDASEPLSVAMPERGGLSVWTAVVAVRLLAASCRVAGFGATAAMPRTGFDLMRTADVVAELAEAALGAQTPAG